MIAASIRLLAILIIIACQLRPAPPIQCARDYQLKHAPTLSATDIDKLLRTHAPPSPAVGIGQTLYNYSLASGIDDIYLMAWWKEESEYGTLPPPTYLHNIGNLRCGTRWCYAESWQQGAARWYKLLASPLYAGGWRDTVDEAAYIYAPPSENDTRLYIKHIKQLVNQWRVMKGCRRIPPTSGGG